MSWCIRFCISHVIYDALQHHNEIQNNDDDVYLHDKHVCDEDDHRDGMKRMDIRGIIEDLESQRSQIESQDGPTLTSNTTHYKMVDVNYDDVIEKFLLSSDDMHEDNVCIFIHNEKHIDVMDDENECDNDFLLYEGVCLPIHTIDINEEHDGALKLIHAKERCEDGEEFNGFELHEQDKWSHCSLMFKNMVKNLMDLNSMKKISGHIVH